MVGGLWRGLTEEAARFAFLLATPVILQIIEVIGLVRIAVVLAIAAG